MLTTIAAARGISLPAIGAKAESEEVAAVDALVERLDVRLREWTPQNSGSSAGTVGQVMDLADHDVLDLMRSRGIEQEVLDLLDEPATR